jgi:hypothetical protein
LFEPSPENAGVGGMAEQAGRLDKLTTVTMFRSNDD